MSDFKGGGINTTDYDSYNTKHITQKTEFTDDVYVFGKLYAEFGGDVQSFSTAGVERVRIHKDGQVTINSDVNAQSFNDVEISVVGSTLTFTVAGIGSTSLTLSCLFLYICYNKKKNYSHGRFCIRSYCRHLC